MAPMANPPATDLEAQLEKLTRDFVSSLVAAIRNASFADVAVLSSRHLSGGNGAARAGRRRGARRGSSSTQPGGSAEGEGGLRQASARRAELSERVVKALQGAGGPLGVRALSSALGVSPDSLAAPLRDLRGRGLVQKHGDKRATTYSAA